VVEGVPALPASSPRCNVLCRSRWAEARPGDWSSDAAQPNTFHVSVRNNALACHGGGGLDSSCFWREIEWWFGSCSFVILLFVVACRCRAMSVFCLLEQQPDQGIRCTPLDTGNAQPVAADAGSTSNVRMKLDMNVANRFIQRGLRLRM
jgi:hypothetical protein